MYDLKTLDKIRVSVKKELDQFYNFLNAENKEISFFELKLRYETVKPLLQNYKETHNRSLLLLEGDETISVYDKEFDDFSKAYFEAAGIAEEYIANVTSKEKFAVEKPSSINSQHENTVKLPVIDLPTFSGDYTQWVQFQDTFKVLINSNSALNNIQRFYYLKSYLKGDAAQVIEALEVSKSNYDDAWSLLKERYDNKRVIAHTHVKALFEFPVIQKESHKSLRQLLDCLNKHLRSLKSLGVPVDYWDYLLIYLVNTKLDAGTKRAWESSLKKMELPKYSEFSNFLTERCQVLESVAPPADNKQICNKPILKFISKPLAATTSITPKCVYCKKIIGYKIAASL